MLVVSLGHIGLTSEALLMDNRSQKRSEISPLGDNINLAESPELPTAVRARVTSSRVSASSEDSSSSSEGSSTHIDLDLWLHLEKVHN